MATEEKSPEAGPSTEAARTPARKKGLLLGGGVVSLVALAWVLSVVAVPAQREHAAHPLQGPFIAEISPPSGFQVNLAGDGGKHFLSMTLNVEVDALEQTYVSARTSDPLYQAKLTDAVLRVASQKTKGELDSAVGKDVFREELRLALDPVLFPIHVGNELQAGARHKKSGLRPGLSADRSTSRGFFYEHELEVDPVDKTIRLDHGPKIAFEGNESDLFVADAKGKGIYVDVSGLEPGFAGAVQAGTFGRVRNVYFVSFLTQ
jgi:flagellar basal body-associated protein FliL